MTKLIAVLALFAVVLSVAAGTATARTRDDANIVQTAVAAGQFKTLTKLLTRAGLVGALQEAGPYTVFAPTDAAFKKVPKKTLNALLRNKAKLKAVLLYHVVSGKVTAADVAKLSTAKTLSGKSVRIRTVGHERLRELGEGHEGRCDGVERRDPRHQPRTDPARALAESKGRPTSSRRLDAAGARFATLHLDAAFHLITDPSRWRPSSPTGGTSPSGLHQPPRRRHHSRLIGHAICDIAARLQDRVEVTRSLRGARWEYGLAAGRRISVHLVAGWKALGCRQFPVLTVACSLFSLTLNPKVAGSIPARPT